MQLRRWLFLCALLVPLVPLGCSNGIAIRDSEFATTVGSNNCTGNQFCSGSTTDATPEMLPGTDIDSDPGALGDDAEDPGSHDTDHIDAFEAESATQSQRDDYDADYNAWFAAHGQAAAAVAAPNPQVLCIYDDQGNRYRDCAAKTSLHCGGDSFCFWDGARCMPSGLKECGGLFGATTTVSRSQYLNERAAHQLAKYYAPYTRIEVVNAGHGLWAGTGTAWLVDALKLGRKATAVTFRDTGCSMFNKLATEGPKVEARLNAETWSAAEIARLKLMTIKLIGNQFHSLGGSHALALGSQTWISRTLTMTEQFAGRWDDYYPCGYRQGWSPISKSRRCLTSDYGAKAVCKLGVGTREETCGPVGESYSSRMATTNLDYFMGVYVASGKVAPYTHPQADDACRSLSTPTTRYRLPTFWELTDVLERQNLWSSYAGDHTTAAVWTGQNVGSRKYVYRIESAWTATTKPTASLDPTEGFLLVDKAYLICVTP